MHIEVAESAAEWLRSRVIAALRASAGPFVLAVSGGSMIDMLCVPELADACDVPYDRLHVVFADERCVPAESGDSTSGELRRRLSARCGPSCALLTRATWHCAYAGDESPADAAAKYGRMIAELGGVTLALLGLGPDGHTASLFPGRPWDGATGEAAMAVFDSPKPPARRVTLTLRALLDAVEVVLVAADDSKAEAARRIVSLDAALPSAALMNAHPNATLLVSPSVASSLNL